MKLKDINTSKFVCNPKSDDFLEEINKIPEFKEFESNHKKAICTWVVLMNDIDSPISKEYTNLYMAKYISAEIAGFKKKKNNNKFQEEFENILIGLDEKVNELVAAYLAKFHPDFSQLKSFLAMQEKIAQNIQGGDFDNQTPKTLDFIASKILVLTRNLFGSGDIDEISFARKSLYAKAEQDRISDRIRPESVAVKVEKGDNMEDLSPYGKYKIEEARFLGDSEECANKMLEDE